MLITHKLSLDLQWKKFPSQFDAMQADAHTRAVEVTLYNGGAAWKPSASVSVAVAFHKPDGTNGLYDTLPDGTAAVTITGNVITAVLAPEVLTAPGTVTAAIVLAFLVGLAL